MKHFIDIADLSSQDVVDNSHGIRHAIFRDYYRVWKFIRRRPVHLHTVLADR